MKKIILLSLALMTQNVFAAKSENIEYYKMGNYVANEACMYNHFEHVALLVDLKANAEVVKDLDIVQLIEAKKKVISYENDTKVIYHSLDYKGYYLIENKKVQKNLYKITEPSVVDIQKCINFPDER